MKDLTSELKAFAEKNRVDLLGIAPIERFNDVPKEHHPASIFPEVRSVLVVGKRIPRGALRGIEEGTHFTSYELYGRSWLVDRILAIATITIATFIEDRGFEAVPLQDLPPQIPPSGIPVRRGLPAPNVIIDAKDAAVRAGLGEIGYCGELLTQKFGPRQRLQIVLTDAELEPTPISEASLCDMCMECVKSCPLGALRADAHKTITICGKRMVVADIDYDLCRRCKNGSFPNPYHDAGLPDRLGAICIRSCVNHLELEGRILSTFNSPFRKRPSWQIDLCGQIKLLQEDEA
jgi:epoxyqueuosine reductase QueG